MIAFFKKQIERLNSTIARGFAHFSRKFPRTAKGVGIVRRRRRPLKILFLLIMHVVGFFMSIDAVMQTRTEQGAIAWAISLNTLPVIAVPAWAVFGDSGMEGYTESRRAGLEEVRPMAEKLMVNLESAEASTDAEGPTMTVLEKLASMPTLRGNKAELLIDGKNTFDSIFKAIDEAEDYILVQFYIVRNDGTGQELKNRLAKKAAEGVKVYALFDDIGSLDLEGTYVDELREAGINVHYFMDFSGSANRFQLNFRNHRKIVVVDGTSAFIGGHNVGDEYLGKHPVRTPWRDSHVKLTGPIAKAVQVPFVEDWHWATGETLDHLNWDVAESDFTGSMEAICLASGPADPLETCTMFFLTAINNAEKRIWIATPYFVPDTQIVTALQMAAMRGVDVKILIPEKTDSELVHLSSFSYFAPLDKVGVEFHRYEKGFLHQKVTLIDDNLATIGSANFDNRSFRLNFEATAVIHDQSFATEVEEMLLTDLSNSRLVSSEVLEDKSYWFKLKVRLARLLAPIQ